MIGYYDTTFEPGQFLPAGFVPMPSEYGAMKNLRTYAAGIRHYRDQIIHSPVSSPLNHSLILHSNSSQSQSIQTLVRRCRYLTSWDLLGS